MEEKGIISELSEGNIHFTPDNVELSKSLWNLNSPTETRKHCDCISDYVQVTYLLNKRVILNDY
jgi:hypothetical protein